MVWEEFPWTTHISPYLSLGRSAGLDHLRERISCSTSILAAQIQAKLLFHPEINGTFPKSYSYLHYGFLRTSALPASNVYMCLSSIKRGDDTIHWKEALGETSFFPSLPSTCLTPHPRCYFKIQLRRFQILLKKGTGTELILSFHQKFTTWYEGK